MGGSTVMGQLFCRRGERQGGGVARNSFKDPSSKGSHTCMYLVEHEECCVNDSIS